jgi:hypothetical protein
MVHATNLTSPGVHSPYPPLMPTTADRMGDTVGIRLGRASFPVDVACFAASLPSGASSLAPFFAVTTAAALPACLRPLSRRAVAPLRERSGDRPCVNASDIGVCRCGQESSGSCAGGSDSRAIPIS